MARRVSWARWALCHPWRHLVVRGISVLNIYLRAWDNGCHVTLWKSSPWVPLCLWFSLCCPPRWSLGQALKAGGAVQWSVPSKPFSLIAHWSGLWVVPWTWDFEPTLLSFCIKSGISVIRKISNLFATGKWNTQQPVKLLLAVIYRFPSTSCGD